LFGGLIGIHAVSRGSAYAEIRLTGLLAAAATFYLLLDLIQTIHGARRLVTAALVATMICLPVLLVLTAPALQTSRLPTPLAEALATVAAVGQPIRAGLLADATSGQRYRLYGSGLGALAVWGLALGLGLALGSKSRTARLHSLLGAAYCTGFLLLSANRGALLSGVVVTCLLGATRYRWLLALAAILMALGGLALPVLADHALRRQLAEPLGVTALSAVDPGPLYVRLDLWQNLLFLMHDFVFTGAGLGLRSGSAVYRDYFRPVDPGFAHAHNGLLQAYLEQGLLGLVGLVGLLALATVVGARALARTRDVDARAVLLASGGAACALTLASLTEIVMITTFGGVLLFGTLGLLVASARLVTTQEASKEPFSPKRQL
jgi:O-antigen ligase